MAISSSLGLGTTYVDVSSTSASLLRLISILRTSFAITPLTALRFVSRISYGLFEYNALMCVRNESICGEDIDYACHFLADSDDTPFSLLYVCA